MNNADYWAHRFKIMEELALKENKNLKDMTLSEMDKLWDKAKQEN